MFIVYYIGFWARLLNEIYLFIMEFVKIVDRVYMMFYDCFKYKYN